MAIGITELRHASAKLAEGFASPVLPVFAVITAAEAGLVLALPGPASDAVAGMLGEVTGLWSLSGAGPLVALIFLLLAIDLFRTALLRPLHRIAVDKQTLTPGEVLFSAAKRMPHLFVVQQVIGALTLAVVLCCMLFGVAIHTVPHAIVTFTMAPAIFAVTAMRRPIAFSLSQAPRVARHHVLAVFGIQGALLVLSHWVSEFFQGATDSMMFGYAAIAMLITYRFASFFGMGTLYFALEDAQAYDA